MGHFKVFNKQVCQSLYFSFHYLDTVMMRSYRMSGPQEERSLSPKITTGEEAAHQQKNVSEGETVEFSCSNGEMHLSSLSFLSLHIQVNPASLLIIPYLFHLKKPGNPLLPRQ